MANTNIFVGFSLLIVITLTFVSSAEEVTFHAKVIYVLFATLRNAWYCYLLLCLAWQLFPLWWRVLQICPLRLQFH